MQVLVIKNTLESCYVNGKIIVSISLNIIFFFRTGSRVLCLCVCVCVCVHVFSPDHKAGWC